MITYRVSWEIDIDADSPRQAAELALDIMRDPRSIGTVFKVEDATQVHVVDLICEEGSDG
jgi:hypothetical protein